MGAIWSRPASWRVLLRRRPLVVLAVSVALFHFANAPMLPLLGQELALAYPDRATLLVSACIITTQHYQVGVGQIPVSVEHKSCAIPEWHL